MKALKHIFKSEERCLEWAEQHVHLLSPEGQAACLHVQLTGIGCCSKCHYLSGCYMCHYAKAVRYHLQKETSAAIFSVERKHFKPDPAPLPLYGGGSAKDSEMDKKSVGILHNIQGLIRNTIGQLKES